LSGPPKRKKPDRKRSGFSLSEFLLVVFEFFGDRRRLLFLRANDAEPSNDVNQDKSPYRNELGIEFN